MKKRKTSKRLQFKHQNNSGTQYIRNGHLNRVIRGSGFFSNLSRNVTKALKSKTARNIISKAKRHLKNKKTQKLIANVAGNLLQKLDNNSSLTPNEKRVKTQRKAKIVKNILKNVATSNSIPEAVLKNINVKKTPQRKKSKKM